MGEGLGGVEGWLQFLLGSLGQEPGEKGKLYVRRSPKMLKKEQSQNSWC